METNTSPPDTLTIEQVATRLGISRALAYDLAKVDRLPAPVLRLGRRLVVPRPALDRALGFVPQTSTPEASERGAGR